MKSQFIEVDNQGNWGKMLVGQFEPHEFNIRSRLHDVPLLEAIQSRIRIGVVDPADQRLVLDLQTREGVILAPRPDRDPKEDLDAHSVWVCPLYFPFIVWLYQQDVGDVTRLPTLVTLPPADPILQGYRRSGPDLTPCADIRRRLIASLGTARFLPRSMTEIQSFMEHTAAAEWPVLRAFLGTLNEREKSRWIGSLLVESGRYLSAPVGAGQIGIIAKTGQS